MIIGPDTIRESVQELLTQALELSPGDRVRLSELLIEILEVSGNPYLRRNG